MRPAGRLHSMVLDRAVAGGRVERLGAEPAEQHLVRVGVVGVELESRALEPLRRNTIAGAICLGRRLGERQSEQRQRFRVAGAAPPGELEAMAAPVAQEWLADGVAGDVEELAAVLRLALGEALPD